MNKKKLIILLVVTMFLGLGIGYVFIKNAAKDYIKVNENYEYGNEHVLVADNFVSDNQTMYSSFFGDNGISWGARVYAIDKNGNVQTVVDIYDGYILDAVVVDGKMQIIIVHYNNEDIDDDSYILMECDVLDMEAYELTTYMSGEIRAFNTETGEVITRTDTSHIVDLRSNILCHNSCKYYVDGVNVYVENSQSAQMICKLDEVYNYVELHVTDDTLYAVCSENYKSSIKIIDMKSGWITEGFSTAEDVVEVGLSNKRLYILTISVLVEQDASGETTVIRSVDESNVTKYTGLEAEDDIRLFGEDIVEIINEGQVLTQSLSDKVNVNFVIKTY